MVPDADVTLVADVPQHGTMAAEILAETTVAANFFANGLGGIFGCPSCHETNPSLPEYLKLFLPYFPLHIQNLIQMYLKIIEFTHTFEMLQNMMNHMEEYQALFKMFQNMNGDSDSLDDVSPINHVSSFFNNNFSMPDINAMKKMMEGSDLVDEFTYVEESSGTGRNGF